MSIAEPMTVLTDYLLAGVALGLAARLRSSAPYASGRARRMCSLALALSGLAAFLGGTLHGLAHSLAEPVSRAGWQVVLHAVGGASFLLVAGALRARVRAPLRAWLTLLFGLKLGALAFWTSGHAEFRYVVWDYASGLVCLLVLELRPLARGEPASRAVVASALLAFLAAGLQQARVGLGPRFNHNDLYHVLQMGVFWLLARGGLRWHDHA